MSFVDPHSHLDVPPGFKPLPPKPSHPVAPNVSRSSAAAAVGRPSSSSSSPPSFPLKPLNHLPPNAIASAGTPSASSSLPSFPPKPSNPVPPNVRRSSAPATTAAAVGRPSSPPPSFPSKPPHHFPPNFIAASFRRPWTALSSLPKPSNPSPPNSIAASAAVRGTPSTSSSSAPRKPSNLTPLNFIAASTTTATSPAAGRPGNSSSLPQKPFNPIPPNFIPASTATALGRFSMSSSSPPELPSTHTQQPISLDGKGERIARKRSKPQILDPSPIPTAKRPRGRPPGSGRKQNLEFCIPDSSQAVHHRDGTSAVDAINDNFDVNLHSALSTFDVHPHLVPTLKAIFNKHGNIAKHCSLLSDGLRTSWLERVCVIVQELETADLTKLDNSRLCAYSSDLKDAEMMNFNVNWLRQRIHEIHGALIAIREADSLANDRKIRMGQILYMQKDLQASKFQLEKLKAAIEAKESQLALQTMKAEKDKERIMGLESMFQRFQRTPLMDGLL